MNRRSRFGALAGLTAACLVLGNAQMVEAHVRGAAGDDDGATAALERARDIYAAKGIVPLLRLAERQLAKLTPR